jgi:hypothetical protein
MRDRERRVSDPNAEPGTETTQAHIRRAPRVAVFLVIGAVLGAIVALVLTVAGHVSPRVGFGATWGFFCLLCVPVGLALGAVVAIVLDQVSRRRSRLVTVERARVDVDDDPGEQ